MNTHRVLIVEQDPLNAEKLTRLLNAEGYEVAGTCQTIAEAAALAARTQPPCTIVAGAAAESQPASDNPSVDTVLSILPSIAIITDVRGCVVRMNAVAELNARCSFGKAVGKPFAQILHLTDRTTGIAVETLAQMTATPDRAYLLEGQGRRIEVKARVTPLGEEGAEGFFLYIEDVTAAEVSLRQLRMLDAALENVGCSVFITGTASAGQDPIIRFCNASFERMSGWTKAEAAGKPISILCPTQREDYWTHMLESLASGRPWKGEGSVRIKGGHDLTASLSALVVSGEADVPEAYVFAMLDNTHVRRMEESLRQSQKIEAVGRLASGIAHDFNNLLSVINSYSDLQIMKLEEGTPVMKYAQQIRAAGRKGVDLVSQLMTFSRRDRPNPTVLDLAQVVEEVKGMLRRVIREDIEMETHYQENLAHIKADQGQIEQILLNLCVNARDAMPSGGKLCIELINRDYDKAMILEHDTIRPGRYLVLCVTDTGCGMDEETQKRIFDPFFTTKEIGKGTGLGLATVHSIMKQYNGHVMVKSRPGDGSRFEMLFPACDAAGAVAGTAQNSNGPAPTGNEKILIVEDDETFLDCISGLLRLHGYQVYAADDGSSALDTLAHINYQIDMLVSDLVLPKLSGREIAARVIEKNPRVKILFMTGYDDQLDTFYSLPTDSTILEKPFPLNSLLVKVRELLDDVQRK
jgi:two-component system, cell cycle sensor histidine kinase and response regulator CckA